MNDKLRKLVDASLADGKEAAERLSRLKGFSLKSLRGLFSCVKWAVKRAEGIAGLTGPEKQAFAIELVLKVTNPPWWLARIARELLPHVIDAVVDALKDRFEA